MDYKSYFEMVINQQCLVWQQKDLVNSIQMSEPTRPIQVKAQTLKRERASVNDLSIAHEKKIGTRKIPVKVLSVLVFIVSVALCLLISLVPLKNYIQNIRTEHYREIVLNQYSMAGPALLVAFINLGIPLILAAITYFTGNKFIDATAGARYKAERRRVLAEREKEAAEKNKEIDREQGILNVLAEKENAQAMKHYEEKHALWYRSLQQAQANYTMSTHVLSSLYGSIIPPEFQNPSDICLLHHYFEYNMVNDLQEAFKELKSDKYRSEMLGYANDVLKGINNMNASLQGISYQLDVQARQNRDMNNRLLSTMNDHFARMDQAMATNHSEMEQLLDISGRQTSILAGIKEDSSIVRNNTEILSYITNFKHQRVELDRMIPR